MALDDRALDGAALVGRASEPLSENVRRQDLPLVKSLTDLHRTRLRFESAPGGATKVSIFVPAARLGARRAGSTAVRELI
jgi:hypothetical protein